MRAENKSEVKAVATGMVQVPASIQPANHECSFPADFFKATTRFAEALGTIRPD